MWYVMLDIALFGSMAPNAARESNDIYVLVTLDGSAISARYFRGAILSRNKMRHYYFYRT